MKARKSVCDLRFVSFRLCTSGSVLTYRDFYFFYFPFQNSDARCMLPLTVKQLKDLSKGGESSGAIGGLDVNNVIQFDLRIILSLFFFNWNLTFSVAWRFLDCGCW